MSSLALLIKLSPISVAGGAGYRNPSLALNANKSSETLNVVNPSAELIYTDLNVPGAVKRGECWEIPKVPKDNIKFLVCANTDKYYLYDSNISDADKAFTKIDGPKDNTIIITLAGEGAWTEKLTLSGEQWDTSLDFYKNCNVVSTETNSWILLCNFSKPEFKNLSVNLIYLSLKKSK